METDMNEYKIYPYNVVSMLPPGNWGARFDGAEGLQALVCWALVETEGKTTIKGMVAAEQHQVLPCGFTFCLFIIQKFKREADTQP